MLGIQHQRNMHRLFPSFGLVFHRAADAEMAADGIIVFRPNTFAVVAVVIPVKKDRAERGQQLIGNIARAGDGSVPLFPAGCSPARRRRYASRPSGARPPVTLPERYGHWRVIRAALNLLLYAFSSSRVGNFPWISKCATSSNSQCSRSRMS